MCALSPLINAMKLQCNEVIHWVIKKKVTWDFEKNNGWGNAKKNDNSRNKGGVNTNYKDEKVTK